MNNPAGHRSSGQLSGATQGSVLSGMRLSKDDERREQSRARFFEAYHPFLFVFFKRKGLPDYDAEDLASDLMLKLLKAMDAFQYDPTKRFRGYLRNRRAKRSEGVLERASKTMHR